MFEYIIVTLFRPSDKVSEMVAKNGFQNSSFTLRSSHIIFWKMIGGVLKMYNKFQNFLFTLRANCELKTMFF